MKNSLTKNNDLDFAYILKILWKGRWKLIIFIIIFFLLGLIYSINLPKIYNNKLTIYQTERSNFAKYFVLDQVLNDYFNFYGIKDKKSSSLNYISITPSNIFNLVRNEFNNPEKIESILDNLSKKNDKFKNFSKKDIKNLSNSFNFFPVVNRNDNFSVINFNWNNLEESQFILDAVFQAVLINVKKILVNNIEDLAKSIDYKNQNKIISLKIKLDLLDKLYKDQYENKIKYLNKHLEIAKELNIKNFFGGNDNFNNFTENLNKKSIDFKEGIPYFVFGYEAIQLELNDILTKSHFETKYLGIDYKLIKQKLIDIESDLTSKILFQSVELIENDDLNKWIKYNSTDLSSKLLHNIKLYCILGIMLGLIFGIAFVLASHHFNFNNKKNYFK